MTVLIQMCKSFAQKKQFSEVLKTHGYPVVSKSVSHAVSIAKRNPDGKVMKNVFDPQNKGRFGFYKWKFLIDSHIPVSDICCDIIKKAPAREYRKATGRMPFLGTMAAESSLRYSNWLKNGCNTFVGKNPSSQPLSFWTEQDILQYLKKHDVPYCPAYGDIVIDGSADDVIDGQLTVFDMLGDYSEAGKLKTTGCNRTGCIFCMFGCHLEKEPNRFQRLKETHPRQYDYCINGGEYDEAGMWRPNKEGLGLGKVLDYIGVPYE